MCYRDNAHMIFKHQGLLQSFTLRLTVSHKFLQGRSFIAVSAFWLLACSYLCSNETVVANLKELNAAISHASPGDVIMMKDGNWHDVVIDFNARANASAPVTLRAQSPGKVILEGNSQLTFSASYLTVDGLFFKQGAIASGSVVTFKSDHCRLTNSTILDYNPDRFETKYYWVLFKGNYNRLDHCFFKGKSNLNPVIGNSDENSRYNTVDRCYIKDIPYVPNANGREIVRVFGYGHADETGDDGAYFTIECNLFDHAHGEGTEIVSLKSNYNIIRFNTVRGTRGGLVGRRGKYNTFEGNFVLGEGQEGTTGIRIAGPNHRVFNNYISDVEEDGIRLITGEFYEASLTEHFKPKKKNLPKYLQVRNCFIAHNTIINAGGNGIDVGYNYKNQWPDIQMILLPENNVISNNLIYNCAKATVNVATQDRNSPLDFLTFEPNQFESNFVFGGETNTASRLPGIIKIDPKLSVSNDGLYRLSYYSPAINTDFASNINDDIEGNRREDNKDAGAIEYGTKTPIRKPLTAIDVGPDWLTGSGNHREL